MSTRHPSSYGFKRKTTDPIISTSVCFSDSFCDGPLTLDAPKLCNDEFPLIADWKITTSIDHEARRVIYEIPHLQNFVPKISPGRRASIRAVPHSLGAFERLAFSRSEDSESSQSDDETPDSQRRRSSIYRRQRSLFSFLPPLDVSAFCAPNQLRLFSQLAVVEDAEDGVDTFGLTEKGEVYGWSGVPSAFYYFPSY